MKKILFGILCLSALAACQPHKPADHPLAGTWKLLSGSLTENGKTTVTDYTKDKSFIKIINEDHFSFLGHDLVKGKDSAAFYTSGGGRYTLKDSVYTELLEYCSAREWENNKFEFTISFHGDTLVQKGIEKVEGTNVNRLNVEKYIRLR